MLHKGYSDMNFHTFQVGGRPWEDSTLPLVLPTVFQCIFTDSHDTGNLARDFEMWQLYSQIMIFNRDIEFISHGYRKPLASSASDGWLRTHFKNKSTHACVSTLDVFNVTVQAEY